MSNTNNLVIITIDCWRADYMSAELTPAIHSLGSLGQIYRSAYANGCGTPDSFPATFASRLSYPFAHQPNVDVDLEYALKDDDVTLAQALQSAGCETAAFVGGNPYLGRRYGYHKGFDTFQDNQPGSLIDKFTGGRLRGALRGMAHRLPISPYPSAEKMTNQALEWLSSREDSARPYFMWVHYMDAHFPTLPPGHRGAKERMAAWAPIRQEGDKYHDVLLRLYKEGIRYADSEIGRLIPKVSSDAAIAVTSDHGQLFGEHASYHHNGVWEQLLRVPLVLGGKGVEPKDVDGIVQLLDLSPHLLTLLGVDAPAGWAGRTLETPPEPIYAVSNNPGTHSYTDARIGVEEKEVRTPHNSWSYPRASELPEMVLA